MRYSATVRVRAATASVNASGAGPPLSMLYLTPKSPSGPPGLWLAERMKPPAAPRSRITALAAGVLRIPSRPTSTRATPLAAHMRRMVWIASRL